MPNKDEYDALSAQLTQLQEAFSSQSGLARQLDRQLDQRLARFERQITRHLEQALNDTLTRLLPSSLQSLAGPLSASLLPQLARGGVVDGDSLIALGGEAGPEAILPLSRGADGRLGVTVNSAANTAPPDSQTAPPVTVHVHLGEDGAGAGGDALFTPALFDSLSTSLHAVLGEAVTQHLKDQLGERVLSDLTQHGV